MVNIFINVIHAAAATSFRLITTATINRSFMPIPRYQPLPPLVSRQVAVIGAGAGGLIAARELRREGHKVVVFEREKQVGGTWVYNPQVERDPLGLDPTRPIIHSSLYESLRTNLPREVMGFTDYPFVPRVCEGRDPRRFPGHREVLLYLEDFAREFEVDKMVRFETEVLKVWCLEEGKSDDGKKNWKVKSKGKTSDSVDEEVYDAIVVCSGHFTEPRIAEVPGISSWPGMQLHSHNYRTPESFQDQMVILIGNSASAVDISRELAEIAKEVHISSRGVACETYEKEHGYCNLWLHSTIESAHEDGSVVFQNGKVVFADIILHCTGYKYHFPFLETNGAVTVDDNRVGPLYKHVFPPHLAQWLSFVGIPYKVAPLPTSELESKWIAGVLSGRVVLPSPDEMMEDVETFYMALEASNIPRHQTHNLEGSQLLVVFSGISSWPGKQMHSHNYRTPENFQDQVVILIGSAASAVDISREVAEVAKEVHISSRGVAGETYEKQHGYDNLWLHSMIESAHEDGSVVFQNGRVVYADIILHCTGYKYQFPFLETNGIVTVDDNRVGPLYKHVFPPDLVPFLSFVGLPFKIVLPSPDEMKEDVKAFYMALEASNRPRHHTHNLGNSQFYYDNWLASQSGSPAIEEWRKQMYVSSSKSRHLVPESYRDEWKDEELVSEAYKYFATLERYNGCISL